MNFKHLAFATCSTMILASNLPSTPLEINVLAQVNRQIQSARIDVSLNELNSPYWLSIYATNTANLKGEVRLDGNVIQSLNSPSTIINLSPYLSRGEHQVIIRGNYAPTDSSVTVELRGKNNQVTQQTGGNGLINQVLMIKVQ